jgi:hypothetical protein
VSDAKVVRSGQDPLVALTSVSYRRFPMLLTISTTHHPATDLAKLLGLHPDAIRASTYPFGHAMVCFSQAEEDRCTVAVMVQHPGLTARPGMLAEVVADVFDSAFATHGGPMPFEVDIPVLPCPGGARAVERQFEPLGYHIVTETVAGGPDDEIAIRLAGQQRLSDLLTHLCTRLPALDPVPEPPGRRAPYAAGAHK